ncbi:MAG: VIT domain-containing protein [Phycisphaeraceae bacterium]
MNNLFPSHRPGTVPLALALCLWWLAGCSVQQAADQNARTSPPALLPGDALAEFAHDEELWIFARDDEAHHAARRRRPGWSSASLHAAPGKLLPLPVETVGVHVALEAEQADVRVHQQFDNSADGSGEVIYHFKLPAEARVSEFVMIVGDRQIRGVIRDRAEAEALYHLARRRGFRASLLTMAEPGLFTHRLAHLEPGQSLAVELTYRQAVKIEGDRRRFTVPAALAASAHAHASDAAPPLTVAMAQGLTHLTLDNSTYQLLPQTPEADTPSSRFELAPPAEPAPADVHDLILRYRVTDAARIADTDRPAHDQPTLDRDTGVITVDTSERTPDASPE